MSSTDQNLNHPNQVDTLDIFRTVESSKCYESRLVTQDFYDRIADPDPYTCYIITDAEDGRVYYGKIKILPNKFGPRYFISQEREGEWIIYVNDHSHNPNSDHLLEVCRFDDVNKALKTMKLYNRVGSHASKNLEIYKSLVNYIKEELSIDDAILSVLIIMGFKEQPVFQDLVQFLVKTNLGWNSDQSNRLIWRQNLSPVCSEELLRRTKAYPDSIYAICNKIYEIFVRYDFFKADCYKEDPTIANLSHPIDDILIAITSWRFPIHKP